jgi:NDP-sugar pyrophosphorylase family protein
VNSLSRRSVEGAKADLPALVLTAGLGTRLKPLSDVRAKPAVPVAGRPLISRILRWLHHGGVRRAVLNLHHRPETITRIVGDGLPLGPSVRYSWEPEVLGSAGGPARAVPLLESDRFLIVNGDTLTNVNLQAMIRQHLDTNALVTMAVVDADPRYNAVLADGAGIVHTFGTVGTLGTPGTPGTLGRFHFIGVQVVNASVFAGVDPNTKSETVHGIYPALIAGRTGSIRIFHTREQFFDIGSPRDYLETARAFASREKLPLDRGRDTNVAADAHVTDSVLWDRVSVGARAHLSRCVVADEVVVPPGARCADCSIVMRGRDMIVVPFTAPEAR